MNPDVNIANRPPAERLAIHADLLACRIRHQCKGLKGAEKGRLGQALLGKISASMYPHVVRALRERAND